MIRGLAAGVFGDVNRATTPSLLALLALLALSVACDAEPVSDVTERGAERTPAVLVAFDGGPAVEVDRLRLPPEVLDELSALGELPPQLEPSDGPDDFSLQADTHVELLLPAVQTARESARKLQIQIPIGAYAGSRTPAPVVLGVEADFAEATVGVGGKMHLEDVSLGIITDWTRGDLVGTPPPPSPYELERVYVTSYQVSGHAGFECPIPRSYPMESFSLNFAKIEYDYPSTRVALPAPCDHDFAAFLGDEDGVAQIDLVFSNDDGDTFVVRQRDVGDLSLREAVMLGRPGSIDVVQK